ncbi:hypothetical protein VQ02_10640 [Methylobacterium variabile]|jgi:ABC-type uncharacterized transport system substrate-binding protein|uniref:ABC transporter substrate-binding protein n=2 Tax=Methylobacterium variabile TaxID=298794 RepID=A0A0J6VJ20_9HYPH|nr:hypothetical protein VQ02_10640 [Methylobacterium variabile]
MIGRVLAAAVMLCGGAGAALAHPHVWVQARAELVLDGKRNLVAIRESWTFDPEYSAFAVLNLDSKRDGVPDQGKLDELAAQRLEAMAETAFFTQGKLNGRPLALKGGPSPKASFSDGRLTLDFTLVPQGPAGPVRTLVVSFDDPDFYVAFGFPAGEPVRLSGTAECVLKLSRPARQAREGEQLIPDEEATGTPGAAAAAAADYTGRLLVACP